MSSNLEHHAAVALFKKNYLEKQEPSFVYDAAFMSGGMALMAFREAAAEETPITPPTFRRHLLEQASGMQIGGRQANEGERWTYAVMAETLGVGACILAGVVSPRTDQSGEIVSYALAQEFMPETQIKQ